MMREGVRGRDRTLGNGVLDDIACIGYLIDVGENFAESLRISRGAGRMLIFTPEVKGETAIFSSRIPPGVVIKALLIGAAIVIDDGLAQVIAVAKRRTANAPKSVYRL